MANIRIPTPLRRYTGSSSTVNVSGATVGQAMDDLLRQHPDLGEHLYDGGKLRSFVNIFLGEEDIRYLDGFETELKDGDTLRIVPSIAGGVRR